jgi:hypothetical protein
MGVVFPEGFSCAFYVTNVISCAFYVTSFGRIKQTHHVLGPENDKEKVLLYLTNLSLA